MLSLPPETIDLVSNYLNKYHSPENSYQKCWAKLNQLRMSGEVCDLTIKCRGQSFNAHKCVLSTVSPYFKALFTSPAASNNYQDTVNFDTYSPECVKYLLDFIYGESSAKISDIPLVLQLAEFIQYDWLVHVLVQCIRKSINRRNCYLWYEVGRTCGVKKLMTLCKSHMIANFDTICRIEECKEWLPHIKEIVAKKEKVFAEEVFIYHSKEERNFFVADLSTKSIKRFDGGPGICWTWQLTEPLKYFHTSFSFFTWLRKLFYVFSYNDTDAMFNPNLLVSNARIQISCYHHCVQSYRKAFLIDPRPLIRRVHEDTYQSKPFHIYSVCYDQYNSLYIIFRNTKDNQVSWIEDGNVDICYIIYKFDLMKKKMSENYVRMVTRSKKLKIVQSKYLGTLMVDCFNHIYNIEHFDFVHHSSNHIPEQLYVHFERRERKCKKMEKKQKVVIRKTWEAASYKGEIFVFNLLQSGTVQVLKLDTKEMSWVPLFSFEGLFGIMGSALTCQGKLFVTILRPSARAVNNQSDKTSDLNTYVYVFDDNKNILLNHKMILPPPRSMFRDEGANFSCSVVPAYLLI